MRAIYASYIILDNIYIKILGVLGLPMHDSIVFDAWISQYRNSNSLYYINNIELGTVDLNDAGANKPINEDNMID